MMCCLIRAENYLRVLSSVAVYLLLLRCHRARGTVLGADPYCCWSGSTRR